MVDCIAQVGKELDVNNQGIVKYLCGIEEERRNLEIIIQKQYQERKRIEADIERLTYKLCLINKILSMRIRAKNNYDKTVEEIKGHYMKLVDSSNKLRLIVEKTQQDLDGIMNKKTGTISGNEEVQTLYVKSGGEPDSCPPCKTKTEIPTKEESAPSYTRTSEHSHTPVVSKSMSRKSKSNDDIEQEIRSHDFEPQMKNEYSGTIQRPNEQHQRNTANRLQNMIPPSDDNTIIYQVSADEAVSNIIIPNPSVDSESLLSRSSDRRSSLVAKDVSPIHRKSIDQTSSMDTQYRSVKKGLDDVPNPRSLEPYGN